MTPVTTKIEAKRLKTRPSVAKCPYCGKNHRVFKRGILYFITCPALNRRRGWNRSSQGLFRVVG